MCKIENNDWLCCARAIVVAKAWHMLGEEKIKENEWKALCRNDLKNSKQTFEALELARQAGLTATVGGWGLRELAIVQDRVLTAQGYQVKVFSRNYLGALIFDPELPHLKTIYLFHNDNHYDAMKNPRYG